MIIENLSKFLACGWKEYIKNVWCLIDLFNTLVSGILTIRRREKGDEKTENEFRADGIDEQFHQMHYCNFLFSFPTFDSPDGTFMSVNSGFHRSFIGIPANFISLTMCRTQGMYRWFEPMAVALIIIIK